MCARLWYALRGLFVGPPPKLSRQLARCLRFRDSGGSTAPSRRSSVARRWGTPPSASSSAPHRKSSGTAVGCLSTRCSRWGAGSSDASGCILRQAHQVHVPLVEVVQGLQARESNRKEHAAQESQRPGLVKDKFADTLKTVRALILRICDSACLNFCAFPRVPEVKRQYPTVLQNVKSFRWMLVCEWMDCLVSTSGPWWLRCCVQQTTLKDQLN